MLQHVHTVGIVFSKLCVDYDPQDLELLHFQCLKEKIMFLDLYGSLKGSHAVEASSIVGCTSS